MRGRIRVATWPAALAAAALIASACGGTDGEPAGTATDGGTTTGDTGQAAGDDVLVVGTTEKPSTIDPAEVYEKFASDILNATTEQLVELEPGTAEVAPGLAESWEISDDGLTYTFTLRSGVTFHDGSDMTSEDVKFSLDRSLKINHPDGPSFLIAGIQSIDTPDDQTVVITIDEPNVTFLSRLNYTVGSILPSDADVYAAPEQRLEEPTAEQADEFVTDDSILGTGPYRLVSYNPDQGAELEAFEDYWGEAPGFPRLRIQFFESSAQMTNALRNGEIDLNINDLGPAERSALEGEEGLVVEGGEGGRIRYIVLDVTQDPLQDAQVRRSMSAGIDRQRVADEVFEGAATPIYSMVPPGFPASADFMSDLDASLDQPVDIELWYPLNKYGDTEPEVAETIARSLNESGQFNVTTKSADWAAEFSGNLNTGAYKAYLLGWYPDYVDPDDYIEPFYHSEKTFIGFYSNPEMDELIQQEQQATNEQERGEIFRQIQEIAAQDMPFIPLYEEKPFAYYSEGLTGVESSIDVTLTARWHLIRPAS